jgi:transcription initiation factor TFIID subunit 11
MNVLRHIVAMHCPSKLSEKYDMNKLAARITLTVYAPQVIQQSLGQQVSQPVAQIVAGFAKVFVGEIVEKGMLVFLDLVYIANNFAVR